jgi:hypothetical protein
MMAGVAVILRNGDGMGLSDDMPFGRQTLRKGFPVVSVENALREMFDLVLEPLEGCSITTADHPGHSSPCATIHRLDDPEFGFFEPMKCHISSNSISRMSPGTTGSGS